MLSAFCLVATAGLAQDRETKVRNDREQFENDDYWIYNNLPKARAEARSQNKSLLIIFRCIPCEACSQFDQQVVKSCIHCQQVREAERNLYRSRGEMFPEKVFHPWPMPAVVGLRMDPRERAVWSF